MVLTFLLFSDEFELQHEFSRSAPFEEDDDDGLFSDEEEESCWGAGTPKASTFGFDVGNFESSPMESM